MNEFDEEKARKALEYVKKRNDYTNEWVRRNKERIAVLFPIGTKERIRATHESVNGYIVRVVLEDLAKYDQ